MPNFLYNAINQNGGAVSGVIESDSVATAEALLAQRGFIPLNVVPEAAESRSDWWSKVNERVGGVKTPELIMFTKQFRSLLQAGIPIVRLMQILEAQTENKRLARIIADVRQDITKGASLHEAMECHPRVFSPLYLSMIKAGEISGAIPEILERLIAIIEHEERIKSDIKSAMQYPLIVLIALGVAFFVLLTFVIPKFVGIFSKAGLTLPLPTKIAMGMYHIIADDWAFLLAGMIMGGIALQRFLSTDRGILAKDIVFLSLPLLGPLFQKSAMSRFASIFSILHASGVPIMNTIKIISGTLGNAAIARDFDRIREQMEEGQGIAGPLKRARYFPPMVVDMVAIGEETGNIEDMLRQISIHYDDEVSYAIKRLSDAIGPVLVVGLAAVVGFFALAIFLPMWDLTKMAAPP